MTPSQTHPVQTVPADASPINRSDLRWLLKLLFMAFAELERMFPGRSFMPRGEAADALAECVAKAHYDLSGFPEPEDGPTPLVIKAAQGGRICLQECPRHLLVLRLYYDGTFEEVFIGIGQRAWAASRPAKRRQDGRAVSLAVLRELMAERMAGRAIARSTKTMRDGYGPARANK